MVAVVLAFLNAIVKPILTIPITIFTLGLFLLAINAIIIIFSGFNLNKYNGLINFSNNI